MMIPSTFCECEPAARRWNGYGTCLACGGAYEARGEIAPIIIPSMFPREARRRRVNATAQARYQAARQMKRCVASGCKLPRVADSVFCDEHREDNREKSLGGYHRRKEQGR